MYSAVYICLSTHWTTCTSRNCELFSMVGNIMQLRIPALITTWFTSFWTTPCSCLHRLQQLSNTRPKLLLFYVATKTSKHKDEEQWRSWESKCKTNVIAIRSFTLWNKPKMTLDDFKLKEILGQGSFGKVRHNIVWYGTHCRYSLQLVLISLYHLYLSSLSYILGVPSRAQGI